MPAFANYQHDLLYEIAISIGNSIELQPMLKESLTTIMRKLDGIAIAVVNTQQQKLAAYPRRGFKSFYLEPIALLNSANDDCLCEHLSFEDSEAYYFSLPKTGTLVFVRRKPMNDSLLKMLGPVCTKLDNSIQACLASAALQQKEQELTDSLMKLQLAQESKDRFLANMSHEIRTPLNGILGFIEQLGQTPLNEEQEHFVNIVQKSSHTLLGVINDILDFSKIESGLMELDEQVFELYEEVSPAIELFKCRASEKNLLLEIEIDEGCHRSIHGDNLRLKQVISNLVSNAIKFTEQGTVKVKIALRSLNETSMKVEFSVRDSGVGITPLQLAKIFNPFTQADKTTTRTHGGTGLGLTISHQLVGLMGGELKVESELGVGSRFYFELDFKLAASKPKQAQEQAWVFDPADRKILLVEDNKVNQLLMQSVLKKFGLVFDLAENGQQAFECYQQNRYDLILMDINMPIMDGIESFKHIRAAYSRGESPYVPVVALTANALVGDCDNYKKIGMQDCLTKPLNLNELKRVLAQHLPYKKE